MNSRRGEGGFDGMDKNEGENLLFSLNICGFSTETEYSESCSVPLLC